MYGVTTALLSTSGLRLVSFPPSYRTKLGSCLETAELSTLCLKSKSKGGITNQKRGIFGRSRKNLCFYALGGEEGCSNLKIIVSESRMSMSLLRKFGKSNPPLDPAHFWFEFVQELSIILRKPNLRLRQGH